MEKRYLEIVAQTMPFKKHQIEAVLKMLEEGNTVPLLLAIAKKERGVWMKFKSKTSAMSTNESKKSKKNAAILRQESKNSAS